MSLASRLPFWFKLHRMLARLHGSELSVGLSTESAGAAHDFVSLYSAYAEATAQANLALQQHGKNSQQFMAADVASMRLFHHVKKMQGLKKAKPVAD